MLVQGDITIAICGHACHGKSTLLGKTIAEMPRLLKRRELERAAKLAAEGRDPSFVFASLVFRDKNPVHGDLQTGITVNPSFVRFDFPTHRVTVIDTPGQDKYTNNRFSAIFQADGALLVVDVKNLVRPITRQVMRILKGYAIPLLGVTISKMDLVDYRQDAYDEAVESVREALEEEGLAHDDTVFFPSSAYEKHRDLFDPGEGTIGFQRIGWWKGPSFKSFMEGLSHAKTRPAAPLRVVIHSSSVYDHVPGVGKTVTGLIESGRLEKNQRLLFEPVSTEHKQKLSARVRSIELTRGHAVTPGVKVDAGVPRQLVGIALTKPSFKDTLRELFKGRGILAGTEDAPPKTCTSLLAQLTVFSADYELTVGDHWMMHCHADRVAIKVEKIVAVGDGTEESWNEAEALFVEAGQWGKVVLSCQRPVAIEEVSALAPLSRLVLRDGDIPLAYGLCLTRDP